MDAERRLSVIVFEAGEHFVVQRLAIALKMLGENGLRSRKIGRSHVNQEIEIPFGQRSGNGGAADVLAAATGTDRETVLEKSAAEMMQLTTGRLIDPQEIADQIVLLASPRSGSTTGSDVIVDAGLRKAV